MDCGADCLGLNPRFSTYQFTDPEQITSQCLGLLIWKLRKITDFHREDMKCMGRGHTVSIIEMSNIIFTMSGHMNIINILKASLSVLPNFH